MKAVRWKNATKLATWAAACEQALPSPDPPAFVELSVLFRVGQLRDRDNLWASLKPVLDALRLPMKGESASWRRGLAERKGFFTGDAPGQLDILSVVQTLESDPKKRGLRLVLTPVEAEVELLPMEYTQ